MNSVARQGRTGVFESPMNSYNLQSTCGFRATMLAHVSMRRVQTETRPRSFVEAIQRQAPLKAEPLAQCLHSTAIITFVYVLNSCFGKAPWPPAKTSANCGWRIICDDGQHHDECMENEPMESDCALHDASGEHGVIIIRWWCMPII